MIKRSNYDNTFVFDSKKRVKDNLIGANAPYKDYKSDLEFM